MNEEMSVKLDELLNNIEKFNYWFEDYIVKVDKLAWQALPDLPGIYLVVGNSNCKTQAPYFEFKQIFYIGVSTTSIMRRWQNHHKLPVFEAINIAAEIVRTGKTEPYTGLEFLQVHAWVNPFASPEYLLWLERKLIEKIQPPCNRLAVGRNRDSEIVETTVIQLPYSS